MFNVAGAGAKLLSLIPVAGQARPPDRVVLQNSLNVQVDLHHDFLHVCQLSIL